MIYKIEDAVLDREYVDQAAKKCWDEVDQMKGHLEYELDWDSYAELNDLGMLRYYTVYTDQEEKVGFACFIISKSLHNKGKFIATSDCMYIEPVYRRCGSELLSLIIKDLSEQNVDWFSMNVKAWLDNQGKLGKSIGCTLQEYVYQRGLK